MFVLFDIERKLILNKMMRYCFTHCIHSEAGCEKTSKYINQVDKNKEAQVNSRMSFRNFCFNAYIYPMILYSSKY